MQAVIMAGGKGTRLKNITKNEIPKPMVAIQEKPLLEWQIEKLRESGIKDIILIIGYLGNVIKEHFDDGKQYGVNISYIEEEEPLGTAGALYYLKKQLMENDFLLVFGDVYFEIDIQRMIKFHQNKKSKATLFVHPNNHPFDSDLMILGEEEKIIKFDSKHNVRNYWYKNCVNAGFYILNKGVCDLVKNPCKKDLEKDILNSLIDKGDDIFGYLSPEYIRDIGTEDRIVETIADIEKGITQKKCLKNKQKCIFLDRDGTINKYKGLISDENDFELEDRTIEAIRKINKSGWLAIMVTNQPVVARGLCSIEDVENIHKKMETLCGNEGVYIDYSIFCPHHPDKGYPEENKDYKIDCACRKPKTGMLEECRLRFNIDLLSSWIIGDTTVDIKTGENAGMKTVLVRTGMNGKDKKYKVNSQIECGDILEAVNQILKIEECN